MAGQMSCLVALLLAVVANVYIKMIIFLVFRGFVMFYNVLHVSNNCICLGLEIYSFCVQAKVNLKNVL